MSGSHNPTWAADGSGADPPVRARVVQIRFHWTERVEGIVSVAFHPTLPKLLTAGCDKSVKVWSWDAAEADRAMPDDTNELADLFHFRSVLTSEERPIPTVAKWSSTGALILAAYVSGEVVIWKPSETTTGYFDKNDERSMNKEHWSMHKTLLLSSDALDACFSACGRFVFSCCANGSVFIHAVENGAIVQQLTPTDAHKMSCQSITVDPLGYLAASAGGDRVLKFYSIAQRKHDIQIKPEFKIRDIESRPIFKECETIIRRGSWSPDGAVYAAPCGWAVSEEEGFRDCVYLFSRANLGRAFAHLSSLGKRAVGGVKFAPFVIAPYGSGDADDSSANRQVYGEWGPMDYRYVLAVWTRDSVSIYTSGSSAKVCKLYDLHYDVINDVAFTPDARYVAVCSNDGYITLARFREPLGKIVLISAGSHPLSRAVAMIVPQLMESSRRVEEQITNPAAQLVVAPATVNVVRAVKKTKPANTGAAVEPRRPREGADPDLQQPMQAQPAASEAATADELCSLFA